MTRAVDYPFVRGWGQMMGSGQYYIDRQVEKARSQNAPPTAIYERDGTWQTIEDVTNAGTREWFVSRGLMTPDWKVVNAAA